MNKHIITLSKEEIAMIDGILLEVCYGIAIQDFINTIGASEEDVKKLFEKNRSYYKSMHDNQINIIFNNNEILIIHNAFNVVHTELASAEFQTRTGYEKSNSMKLQNKIEYFVPS